MNKWQRKRKKAQKLYRNKSVKLNSNRTKHAKNIFWIFNFLLLFVANSFAKSRLAVEFIYSSQTALTCEWMHEAKEIKSKRNNGRFVSFFVLYFFASLFRFWFPWLASIAFCILCAYKGNYVVVCAHGSDRTASNKLFSNSVVTTTTKNEKKIFISVSMKLNLSRRSRFLHRNHSTMIIVYFSIFYLTRRERQAKCRSDKSDTECEVKRREKNVFL